MDMEGVELIIDRDPPDFCIAFMHPFVDARHVHWLAVDALPPSPQTLPQLAARVASWSPSPIFSSKERVTVDLERSGTARLVR